MKKMYDRIIDIRGNLITVMAKGIKLGELAEIYRASGEKTLASVLSFDGEKVTLQTFESPRGLSTGDSANVLTPHVGDANTMITEFKAFLCNVNKA